MSDRVQYFVSDIAAVFIYSLIFGGFLTLPIFAGWFYIICKANSISRFLWAWGSLVLVATLLFLHFLGHLHSVNEGYERGFESSDGGPISPFPNIPFLSVMFPMILAFSSVISPLLLVFVLASWRRYKYLKQII